MLNRALKLLRIYHQMTQEEVGELVGVGKSFISELELGNKSPSLEVLGKYAEAFNISLSSLFFLSESVAESRLDRRRLAISKKVLSVLEFIAEKANVEK